MNIYIGNLPKTTNADAVRKAFEPFGEVGEVTLVRDKFSNELRGFGFVEMPGKAHGADAIKNLNGSEIDGRNIVVNEAKPRKDNKSRGGGGKRW